MASDHSNLDSLSKILKHDPAKHSIQSKLTKTSAFKDFNRDEIELLVDRLHCYRAEKGDAIFIEGLKAGYLCIIIEGRLDVLKDTGKGNSRKIGEVPAGRIIGEMSLLDGEPHSATAIASEITLLAALTQAGLDQLVKEQPVLGAKLYRAIAVMVSRRLRRTDAALVNFLD